MTKRENIAATIMLYKDLYCLKPKNKSALGLYATRPRAPADEGAKSDRHAIQSSQLQLHIKSSQHPFSSHIKTNHSRPKRQS